MMCTIVVLLLMLSNSLCGDGIAESTHWNWKCDDANEQCIQTLSIIHDAPPDIRNSSANLHLASLSVPNPSNIKKKKTLFKNAVALINLMHRSKKKLDLLALPEYWHGTQVDDNGLEVVNSIASHIRLLNTNAVVPIKELFISENGEKRIFNTAYVINRTGDIVGKYRKSFPWWGTTESMPTFENVPVFDLDFGRIAVLMCFDINFPELWLLAGSRRPKVVVWPSTYPGGDLLWAYSRIYGFYILPSAHAQDESPVVHGPWGAVEHSDKTTLPGKSWKDGGGVMETVVSRGDFRLHVDFNADKVSRADAWNLIESADRRENWMVLKQEETAKDLNLEWLVDYQDRSRRTINNLRNKKTDVIWSVWENRWGSMQAEWTVSTATLRFTLSNNSKYLIIRDLSVFYSSNAATELTKCDEFVKTLKNGSSTTQSITLHRKFDEPVDLLLVIRWKKISDDDTGAAILPVIFPPGI